MDHHVVNARKTDATAVRSETAIWMAVPDERLRACDGSLCRE